MAKQLFLVAMFMITFVLAFATTAMAAALRADQTAAIDIPDRKLQFKVCGNYCGPNWCANQVIAEDKCVAQGIWGIPAASDSVVDSCCRTHDDCCGKGVNRPACNTQIVSCIQAKKAYWSFCGAAVWAAMKAVSGWCCGSACPTFTDPAVPLTLAGKQFSDGIVRITFTTEDSYIVEAVTKVEGTNVLKHAAATADSVCSAQTYALGKESLIVNMGPMMADSTNKCGKKLMAAGAAEHKAHALLDNPDNVLYWPHADIIAVNDKMGGVVKIPRSN